MCSYLGAKIVITTIFSSQLPHMLVHLPRHDGGCQRNTRNVPLPSGVDDWEVDAQTFFVKPCKCNKTHSPDSPSDTSEIPPSGTLYQMERCAPPTATPPLWGQFPPTREETPLHPLYHQQLARVSECFHKSTTPVPVESGGISHQQPPRHAQPPHPRCTRWLGVGWQFQNRSRQSLS